MKLAQLLKFSVIIILSTLSTSCSNDDNAPEPEALNAIDLKILENCGEFIENIEGVNCCIVTPLEVTTDGFYVGGAKYLISDGETTYEPNGLTYLWNITGEGIEINNTTAQMVKFTFTEEFNGGIIETKIFAQDGSERCSARDTVYLKN